MLLVDQKPLELDALNDPKHKLHDFAKEYDDTLKELYVRYTNGFIRFKRPGFPRYVKGMDEQGREISKMVLPTPPMRIPLKAYATTGKLGKHLWMCCQDTPEVLANGLWDMGRKRALSIKEDILVDIKKEPDLAFFLCKISPFVRRGLVKIADPVADDKKIGEEERELTERKYAVWNLLSDEAKLKTMARAYGLNNVETKQPNAIRKELETALEKNDALKRQNPIIKGTREFLEEMKVTDSVLLRNFVQKAIDDKKLEYRADGRWKIGEKNVIQVPASDLERTKEYLCDYLMMGNHIEKLQEFLKDLINKEYLEGITEKKEWAWLAKVANIPHEFKEAKKVTENVTAFYCPV